MSNTVININITKAQEKQFIKVPFDVPFDVESMTISYSHYGDNANSLPKDYEKNVIDLALLDNNGNEIGATGSNKKSITISASYSTPGYDKVEINPGKWTIICGAYLVQSSGLEVIYTIEYKFKHHRWLKGDLHMHSVNSDGKLTVNELGERAVYDKLDYIIVTDHNNFFHNKRLPDIKGLTIIPGVEFTHYNGHMNIWGIETPYGGSYAVNSLEEFIKLNREAKDRGGIVSLNHPKCSLCPWKWGFDGFHYDAVEVWNGPMRIDNLTAINWWHNELVKGRKLTAVGGSDYHRDIPLIKLFARPVSMVYSQSNSKTDILNAILRGRVTITRDVNSPYIEMNSEDAIIGDSVNLQSGTEINIRVSNLKRNHTLVVYDKEGITYSYKAKRSGQYEVTLPVTKKGFIRAEIMYSPKLIERMATKLILFFLLRKQASLPVPDFVLALTNPIYYD